MPVGKFDKQELFQALFSAQSEFTALKKSGANNYYNSKFSTALDIQTATAEALKKYGLILFDDTSTDATGLHVVSTYLLHVDSGEYLISTSPIPAPQAQTDDGKKSKKTSHAQDVGIYETYFKRYHRLLLLGLADADDNQDGNMLPEQLAATASKTANNKATTTTIVDDDDIF